MDEELKSLQQSVGASDEEIAAIAKISKTTYRRALKREVPEETRNEIFSAIETIRRNRIDRLTKLKVRTAG